MTARRLLPLLLGAALLVPTASAQAQKIKKCPKAGRTLAVDRDKSGKVAARVFKRQGVVYGCSTYYPSYGRVTKLGRFSPRMVRVDGGHAVWVVRKNGNDKVTAAELYSGTRNVKGRAAVPRAKQGGARHGAKIDALRLAGDGLFAWISATGTLVVGGQSLPDDVTVTLGDGTTRTAYADDGVAALDTLTGMTPAARRKVVRQMGIEAGDGDGDECGGSYEVAWTWKGLMTPLSAAGFVDWDNPSC